MDGSGLQGGIVSATFSDRVTGDFDSALDAYAAGLKGNVARAGAQAMAQVVYDNARGLVPVSSAPHIFYGTHGRYPFRPGTLRNAIYQVFSQDNSSAAQKTYHVSWNHTKAPYGFMVEFGTSTRPAHPFLYPAYAMSRGSLLGVANATMAAALAGLK